MARNRQSGRLPWIATIAIVLATSWTVFYHVLWRGGHIDLTLLFYIVVTLVVIASLISSVRGRSFTHLPPATGRVLVLVPAFNERPELLRDTVQALASQTRPPDAIHVMDDGSAEPVVPFPHPLVTWHRQSNQGKRHAQANILAQVDPATYDFIVTVDSDSVLAPDALEHVLRAMSNPRVQAATGLTLVRNRTANLLTRVIDLEIVTWCLVTRMLRSRLGVVAPTSGILAVYRKRIVLDNLADYVSSGTAGDDRRLTHYALAHGQVVAVNEALVYSEMPETLAGLWRQRVRWFKSYWRYVPWEIQHFRPLPFLFRLYSLVVIGVAPIVYFWIAFVVPAVDKVVFIQGLAYWVIFTYAQTAVYATSRPRLGSRSRLAAFVLLTPLVSLVNLVVIKPSMYYALTKARNESWQTRGDQVPISEVATTG